MTTSATQGPLIGIVGAGLVGLATGRRLASTGQRVVVFDKEPEVAAHQSGHNSGVVHSGIYYLPGSAKARMCRRGATLLHEYCNAHGLPWDERGKLVVARNEDEVGKLRVIESRAQANGVPGVRWLDTAALREMEPDVAGLAALLSPHTAIVDYPAIARSFADDIRAAGGLVLTSTRVLSIRQTGEFIAVESTAGSHQVSSLIICAGLQSAELAALAGFEPAPEIVPFRGEYLRLREHARQRVSHLIYPVPDPAYPFLGVHLTPRVDGSVDIGPNAVLALAREGYRRTDFSMPHVARLARSAAFRHLARQHWRAGLREMRGSYWRRSFLAEARTYLPWITAKDVERGPSGVRAQAVDPDGSLVEDFRIERHGAVIAVRNAPSPAATSCLAIAEHIVAELQPTGSGR
jgi:L-2-hydroxyglutarate oxidase LhgO